MIGFELGFSCIFVGTYLSRATKWWGLAPGSILNSTPDAGDYVMCLLYAPSIMWFVFWDGLGDFLSLLPAIAWFLPRTDTDTHTFIGFLPILRVFKASRVLRMNRVLKSEMTSSDINARRNENSR